MGRPVFEAISQQVQRQLHEDNKAAATKAKHDEALRKLGEETHKARTDDIPL